MKQSYIIAAAAICLTQPLPAFAGCGGSGGRMLICEGGRCIERPIGNECSNTTMISYGERGYREEAERGYDFLFSSFLDGKALQVRVRRDGKQLYYGSPSKSPWQVGVCQAFPYQNHSCSKGFINPADSEPLRRAAASTSQGSEKTCTFNAASRKCKVSTRATGALLPYEADAMIEWQDGDKTTIHFSNTGDPVQSGDQVLINRSLWGKIQSVKRSCEWVRQVNTERCSDRIKFSSPTGNVVEYTHEWGI